MDPQRRIESLIEAPLEDMGYELVRVRLSGSERRTLQIMVERVDGDNMRVENCAKISRALSAIFDVEDPIRGAYTLEVSSPGIDRPLTRTKDFDRFTGHLAKFEMQTPIKGRKRYSGIILGVKDDTVQLATKNGNFELPMDEIVTATLVITDELIAASQDSAMH